MTDLVCDYEPWKGGMVHKGMKVYEEWTRISDRILTDPPLFQLTKGISDVVLSPSRSEANRLLQ
jgi:hypothetical protein